MNEKAIERLFLKALDDPGQNTDVVRRVFSILLKATLRYRDDVLSSSGVVVTVADVRSSLELLVPALALGNVPVTDNKVSLGLLELWLNELRLI
ncbi:MAG: hypothetical protein SV775_16570 [Thermodesulfobacteriota bacterium]|nr:hypothetical protein [Thermodesulfobacteriota bacterium]